jgi:3-keto-5-aminohexanoate cleavage enzyme
MPATTMITAAPTGAETAKTEAPSLPVTLDELVRTARACAEIGASVVRVHIRDAGRAETREVLGIRSA